MSEVLQLEALVSCHRYEEAQKFSNTLLRPGETDIDVLYWRARALYYLVSLTRFARCYAALD